MFKILIVLLVLFLCGLCFFAHEVFAGEKDDSFRLEKKDYKMEKKDYDAQILMVVILVALAFILG